MTAQRSNFNSGVWAALEGRVRGWMCADTLYVVTGCHFDGSQTSTIDNGGNTLPVPTQYYKVLLRSKSGSTGRSVASLLADGIAGHRILVRTHRIVGTDPPVALKSVSKSKTLGFEFFVNVPNAPKATAPYDTRPKQRRLLHASSAGPFSHPAILVRIRIGDRQLRPSYREGGDPRADIRREVDSGPAVVTTHAKSISISFKPKTAAKSPEKHCDEKLRPTLISASPVPARGRCQWDSGSRQLRHRGHQHADGRLLAVGACFRRRNECGPASPAARESVFFIAARPEPRAARRISSRPPARASGRVGHQRVYSAACTPSGARSAAATMGTRLGVRQCAVRPPWASSNGVGTYPMTAELAWFTDPRGQAATQCPQAISFRDAASRRPRLFLHENLRRAHLHATAAADAASFTPIVSIIFASLMS